MIRVAVNISVEPRKIFRIVGYEKKLIKIDLLRKK